MSIASGVPLSSRPLFRSTEPHRPAETSNTAKEPQKARDIDESIAASRHVEAVHHVEARETLPDLAAIYRPPVIDAINPQKPPPEIHHTVPTAPFFILTPQGPVTYYWQEFFEGVKRARRERRLMHLTVKYPVLVGDVRQQVQLLKEMLDESPSGVALSLPQVEPFLKQLERARAEYVPILLLNSPPHHEADPLADFKLPFVSVDHYLAGQLAAAKSKSMGYVPSRTLVLDCGPDHMNHALRYRGICDVLSEGGRVDLLTLPAEPDEALTLVRQYYENHDDLSGVFCLGAPVLKSVGQWLANIVKESDFRIFASSFDQSPMTQLMIQRQVLRFSVDLNPFRQGELCADNAHQTFRVRPTVIEFDPEKNGLIQDRSL